MARLRARNDDRTLFLIDEWAGYRRSLRLFLEAAGHRVSGEADTVKRATTLPSLARANVVVVEPRPTWRLLETDLTTLRLATPAAGVVLLSSAPLPAQLVLQAADWGISAYLTKDDDPAVLLLSLEAASSRAFVTLPRQVLSESRSQLESAFDLTRREREILMLAACSLSNRQIAEMLYVTLQTVQFHLDNTYRKLGVATRAAAVAAATSLGLLS